MRRVLGVVLQGALLSALTLYQRCRHIVGQTSWSEREVLYTERLVVHDREQRRVVYELLDDNVLYDDNMASVLELVRTACALGMYGCTDYATFNGTDSTPPTQVFLSQNLGEIFRKLRAPLGTNSIRRHSYQLLRLLDLSVHRLLLYLRVGQGCRDIVANRRLHSIREVIDVADHVMTPPHVNEVFKALLDRIGPTKTDLRLVREVGHFLREHDFRRYRDAERAAALRRRRRDRMLPLPR